MSTPPPSIPKVSIGMGAFNSEAYIRKAIDTLLAQTFKDFELIISDDASTDGTETICREYAARDVRIRYVRQDVNLGVNINYKFLLDHARGKYFMWAEDNDVWLPTCVAECVRVLSSDRSVSFVVAGHRVTSRFSPLLNRVFPPKFHFVADNDPKRRVLAYSKMPFVTHKDDMCYALWDRLVISGILSDIQNSDLNKVLIGGPMNEYALALHKGAFVDRVLWYKTYRFVPPGHLLNPIIGIAATIWRVVKPSRCKPRHQRNSPELHPEDWASAHELLHQTAIVLRLAGFDERDVRAIVANHKAYMKIV